MAEGLSVFMRVEAKTVGVFVICKAAFWGSFRENSL